jgi:hypothetical protein
MTYKELINSTIVPDTLSNEEKFEKYDKLRKYVNSKLPNKLYRFRRCTERSLDSLYKDELWFANGREMNDDFDARIFYNKKKINEWIKSQVDSEGNLIAVERLLELDAVPVELEKIIPNAEYLFQTLKTMPREFISQTSHIVIQMLLDNLDRELMRITDIIQGGTKFACFTEKIYSDMMWGHYTDDAAGFAVEYEFGKECHLTFKAGTDERYSIGCNLFPILYGNQRIDATEYAKYLFQISILNQLAIERGIQFAQQWLNKIVPCPDSFMVTKLAIKKSNDWKAEKEWRLFLTSNNMAIANEKYSSVKMRPSAVYLGRKISNIHQKIIMDIAREKVIPVYKMDINENSNTYRLRKIKL